jgi:hypothetical protein
MTVRVIQWATGNTGRLAVQAIAARSDLELVGVRVYDPAKAGRDAGDVCGTRPLGLMTTADRASVLATPADVVLYMGSVETEPEGCFADVIELLGSGRNVVATGTAFIDPLSLDGPVGAAMAEACERGNATFLGLGIHPGFVAEVIPVVLSRLSERVDRLICREAMSYAEYPSRELMFDVMGFGATPDDPAPRMYDPSTLISVWQGSIAVLAEALSLNVRSVTPFREVRTTDHAIDVASGHIAEGTVAAMRLGIRADCGATEILIEHITRMADELAPDWPSEPGYEVIIDGAPSMRCHFALGINGETHSEQGCLATAMHAIHAIPAVIAARPGVMNLASIGSFAGADAFDRA